MATIEWRTGKRGRYAYLNWSDNEGQHRQSLGAIDEHTAETHRLAKELEQRTGRTVISTAPLVGVVAVMYCAWHAEQYPTSHYRTKQIIDDHILPAFQYVAADQLGVRQVERWGHDRAKVVEASSAAKEVRTLKAMLNWAIRNEVIAYAPATKAVPPQDVTSNPRTWYSMEQLQALYTASPLIRKAQWQFMANTGIRRNEAHNLPREQVKGTVMRVCSNPEARTKSRKWREIPLSTNAQAALSVLLTDNETDYVFPICTANSLSLAFADDAAEAGIGGSLHCLRHSFGTHHAIKGTPVKVIQELMGHASITTTMKYLHVAEEHRKKAFDGFEL